MSKHLLKPTNGKKNKKANRELRVLMGLVELFLKSGKPIGSNTLKEHGFDDLSSATIRNYFAQLEDQGYLKQQHSSGGRIPTEAAYKLYAHEHLENGTIDQETENRLKPLRDIESRELHLYLQQAAETLSELSGYAVFLSSPRFDQDFILDIKLLDIDSQRVLAVIITDFGVIQPEILYTSSRLDALTLKKVESYFQWRFHGQKIEERPHNLDDEDENLACNLYNEIIVRYIARYSNFTDEDLHRTGVSKLLLYPEFNEPIALATSLTLFENSHQMRVLLNDCLKNDHLSLWVGSDLNQYAVTSNQCTVIAIPYRINQVAVGGIGILGPSRMQYPHLFGLLQVLSEYVSHALTKNLYKFKVSFRQPHAGSSYLSKTDRALVEAQTPLLEEGN